MPAIERSDEVSTEVLRVVEGCRALDVPMLVTEQYPKGLGNTLPAIRSAMAEWYRPIEKMSFSATGEMHFMQQLELAGRHQVLLCGVETHVCVYQTARDLHQLGWHVEVISDAVGSRAEPNYRTALEKLARMGVELTSVEMALFEMMVRADIPEFKSVSKIVK